MNADRIRRHVETLWDDSIVPELVEYIRIPNKSPHFDPDWEEHGYMEAAALHMVRWCEAHAPRGMELEVVRLPGRTPLIFIEVPGEGDDCLLLYGHLDKQPEMTGWRDGLGPLDAENRRGPALRTGRGGRRLRDLRLPRRPRGIAGAGGAARALRGDHRGLRGERELRSPPLHRGAPRAYRHPEPRRLPRFGLRRLRPALVHHVASRPRGRHPQRGSAGRGRPLRGRGRDRALDVPHPPEPPLAHRGRARRADSRRFPARADPARAARPGRGGGRRPRQSPPRAVPFRGRGRARRPTTPSSSC